MRMWCLRAVLVAALSVVGATGSIVAQQPVAAPAAPVTRGNGSDSQGMVRVDVVISRFQGEKRTGNFPYTLYATIGTNSSLRLGQNVPITTSVIPQGNDKATTPVTSYQYQDVGTNIDVGRLKTREDGRFEFDLTISASFFYAVAGGEARVATTADRPVFGQYTVSNHLIATDRQLVPFSIATDRITGESFRAEVTITALK